MGTQEGLEGEELFDRARRIVRWHYQWIVTHDFLRRVVGRKMAEEVLRDGTTEAPVPASVRLRHFTWQDEPYIPIEFSGAAYRFGHSMVRPSYRANLKGDEGNAFFGMIFDPAGDDQDDPVDLRGGARAPRRFIGWQTFFDYGDGEVRPNKTIDTKISTPLFNLPLGAIASHDQPQVLPQRNLLRQLTWSMPSGQAVASAMSETALSKADLSELQPYGFQSSTPLWYYCLKEAEVRANGLTLGPVGGRIVAEVLIGLIKSDPASYLARERTWTPTAGGAGGSFRMKDFLSYAGVDPASRHAVEPSRA